MLVPSNHLFNMTKKDGLEAEAVDVEPDCRVKLGEEYDLEPKENLRQRLEKVITSEHVQQQWLPSILEIGGCSNTPLGILFHQKMNE